MKPPRHAEPRDGCPAAAGLISAARWSQTEQRWLFSYASRRNSDVNKVHYTSRDDVDHNDAWLTKCALPSLRLCHINDEFLHVELAELIRSDIANILSSMFFVCCCRCDIATVSDSALHSQTVTGCVINQSITQSVSQVYFRLKSIAKTIK